MGRGRSKAGGGLNIPRLKQRIEREILNEDWVESTRAIYGRDPEQLYHSPTFVSGIEDKISSKAFDAGWEITIKEMESMRDRIIKGLKTDNRAEKAGVYSRIPYSVVIGSRYATADDKKAARETITRFMNSAKAGDVYEIGGGVGSSGNRIEIVTHRRSPNGLGIKTVDSPRQAVAMSRENVLSYIKNGARKVKKKR